MPTEIRSAVNDIFSSPAVVIGVRARVNKLVFPFMSIGVSAPR